MTAIASEVDRFNRLAATWWNRTGPMRPLHVINELRFAYLLDLVAEHRTLPRGDLTGLRVLDIGCGAGLLCEPLSARGASVTGVDAAEKNIAVARLHASNQKLGIDYRVGEPNHALGAEDLFDVVLMLEVVEHVDDVADFVVTASRHLAPGGLLVASTIDRTLKSFFMAIVGAEFVLRLLPRGTHHWRQFVRPAELGVIARSAGLAPVGLRGMRYLPFVHRASWVRSTAVNYIASFRNPA